MNPQKNPFTGVCTALITPFQPDGSLDLDALARLIEDQIAAGIDALLLLGTTGESATVTDGERLRLRCTRQTAASFTRSMPSRAAFRSLSGPARTPPRAPSSCPARRRRTAATRCWS